MLFAEAHEPGPPSDPPGHAVGDRVLVAREGGLAPLEALVVAHSGHRPHLVKVQYVRSRAAAWISRRRIVSTASSGGAAEPA
ncbi:MAG: hypothetical protein ACLGI5_15225 [Thermoleophilia bacterium]